MVMKGQELFMIYLDNASTTKPCAEAVSAINSILINNFGNPSSLHKLGVEAEIEINKARKIIAAALVADPECVYFTSGATESNNLAINGIVQNYGKRRKKIITTAIEHPSVAEPIKRLEELGFEVVRIQPNPNGEIEYELIISALDDNVCMVSCMLVNNENGAILPIKKAFTYIKRNHPEIITHCDAVQGFMKIPFKVSQLFADVISISAHKINGPKGIGAIYIKKGIRVAPQINGGGQEKKMRSGTESVPLIAGFGAAVEVKMHTVLQRLDYVQGIKNYFIEKVEELAGITVLSSADASPYIVTFAVEGIKSETMLHFLESKDIYVSSGSACSKGKKSEVLKAFNVNEKLLDFAIRISFSDETIKEEIDTLIEAIREGQASIQRVK
jgi:cysteine desulfurase